MNMEAIGRSLLGQSLLQTEQFPDAFFQRILDALTSLVNEVKTLNKREADGFFFNPKTNDLLSSCSLSDTQQRDVLGRIDFHSRGIRLILHALRYFLIRVANSRENQCEFIASDFDLLKECIFGWANARLLDQELLDMAVKAFIRKSLQMLETLVNCQCEHGTHSCNIMSRILIKLGRHPHFGVFIMEQLIANMREQNQSLVKAGLTKMPEISRMLYDLHILRELLDSYLLSDINAEAIETMKKLKYLLKCAKAKNKSDQYLLKNIYKQLQIYLMQFN